VQPLRKFNLISAKVKDLLIKGSPERRLIWKIENLGIKRHIQRSFKEIKVGNHNLRVLLQFQGGPQVQSAISQ